VADLNELKSIIESQGKTWQDAHQTNDRRLAAVESTIDDLAKRAGRLGIARGATPDTEQLSAALKSFAVRGSDVELKAMSIAIGSDPGGGYLVVPQLDSAVRLIRDRVSPLSALCRTVTLDTGNELILPFSRTVLAGLWVAENQNRQLLDDPEWGQHRVPLRECYVAPSVGQLVLDQSGFPIDALILDMVGHGLATTEAVAIHTGDGVGRPRGFLSYETAATADATRALGTIQHIPTGKSADFADTAPSDVLATTVGALSPQYRANARWLMNRTVAARLMTLKDGTGAHLWQRGLALGQPDALMGFPIVIDDQMPDAAADSLSIAFGDFEQAYCIVRSPGVRLLRDPYTERGSVIFYSYVRIGGALVDDRAVKLIRFATT
jgi:HK97 family phage major capsid protein